MKTQHFKLKNFLFSAISLFFFMNIWSQTNIYDTIKFEKLDRTYLLHIPPSYNQTQANPIIIALHGGGAPGWMSFDQTSQLITKSNESGFLLVYPEGVKVLGKRTWNGGGCCSFAVTTHINDVGFINALIDSISSKYNIDSTRIYATGISNGAIMTYRLASELSNRIAAIATISGTLEDSSFNCTIKRPVPIMHFHSVLDSNIYINGGYGTSGYLEHKFNSVEYGLQKFASLNQCASVPDSFYFIWDNSFYYKKIWKACDCNAEQVLYVTGDGGHSWPGGNLGLGEDADLPSSIIKANDSIWSFFQKHTLTCVTNSRIDSKYLKVQIKISPNPFSSQTSIQVNQDLNNANLIIYDAFGKKVKQIPRISNRTITLHRENLSNGLYFLQLIEDSNIIATEKFEIKN